MSGWGNLFGKIADQFQGRAERLKNERERLLKEKQKLLKGEANEKTTARMLSIDTRLNELNGLLANAAK